MPKYHDLCVERNEANLERREETLNKCRFYYGKLIV